MRFELTLTTLQTSQRLTLNYQYPIAAAIYKIIQRADEDYASFLHTAGYRHGAKSFKLFTFSDLRTPFYIINNRMVMATQSASLTVCFHVPDAAEHFICGLFKNQQFVIADGHDKASFMVQQVQAEKMPSINQGSYLIQPMSPVVVGRKNERGNYDYVAPMDEDFASLVSGNLLEKYAALNTMPANELEQVRAQITVEPVFFQREARGRLLTIKEGTAAETKIRGYDKFRIKITAPAPVITIALNAGIGMHNAMGMGCVAIV